MPEDGNLYLKMDERPFRFAIQAGDGKHAWQNDLIIGGFKGPHLVFEVGKFVHG